MQAGRVGRTKLIPADPSLELLRGVDLILHAGDVGERGGHQEILALLLKIAPTLCVRGNVDVLAEADEFPAVRVLHLQGWTIVITHIAGDPPSQEALQLAHKESADILVFGHSHKFSVNSVEGVLFINPGSAGPARFKLARTAAVLTLPTKASGEQPHVRRIELANRAPPRLPLQQAAIGQPVKRKRRGGTPAALTPKRGKGGAKALAAHIRLDP